MSAEAAETVTQNDRETMSSGEARVLEQHLVNSGEPRTFLSTKAPYRDAAGRTLGVISVSRDITERKLLELEIAQQAIRDPLDGPLQPEVHGRDARARGEPREAQGGARVGRHD